SVRIFAQRKLSTVIQNNFQLFHVVHCLAAEQRVGPTRIVSDHSAYGAAAVGGGIGSEDELMRPKMILQCIQHNPRLDAREFLFWINLHYLIHVLGEVE